MSRNSINLIFIAAILILIMGCFCRSDRESDISSPPAHAEETDEPASNVASAPASADKKKDRGDFIVEHLEITTPRYQEIDRQVQDKKILEKAADKLNAALILPEDIYLRTKDCSQPNAFYDGNDRSVTMCYELMEHFYNTFKSNGNTEDDSYDKMFDAVRFVFLHEIAHALIHQYNLPIGGNEEDAADRCSAFINLKELGDEGVRAVFAAADAFAIESRRNSSGRKNMADEHLLREQRFYNSLCMIYGSNTTKHDKIVTEGYLPKERAVRCPGEYQRAVESWMTLLAPWRKQ